VNLDKEELFKMSKMVFVKIEPKKYNGYTNYETWNFSLWLNNEESTNKELYNLANKVKNGKMSMDKAIECLKNEYCIMPYAIEEKPLLHVSQEVLSYEGINIKRISSKCDIDRKIIDFIKYDKNPIANDASMYNDLLGAAIEDLDFKVITDRIMDNDEIIEINYAQLMERAYDNINFEEVIKSNWDN
jgi:hypothetical protein